MPTMTEWQFIVGCVLGAGVGITLSRNGIMLTKPETRWTFLSAITGFAGAFALICAWMNRAA